MAKSAQLVAPIEPLADGIVLNRLMAATLLSSADRRQEPMLLRSRAGFASSSVTRSAVQRGYPHWRR